eukprot:280643-Rhodomonas_salina.2
MLESLDQGVSPSRSALDRQQYLDALHSGSHEVYISSVADADAMAAKGEKLAIPCSFGVHCNLHVRPTLREKTRGLWLSENSREDLAVQPQELAPTKGPWQSQPNDLLASTEQVGVNQAEQLIGKMEIAFVAVTGMKSAGQTKHNTMSSLNASEKKIKEEIAKTLKVYTHAG